MVQVFDLGKLGDTGRHRVSASASIPVRICVSSQLREFADIWPRSDKLGAARCYAFQCADILELTCETLILAQKAQPLFVAILGANDDPLALLPLCIETHNRTRVLTFLDGGFSDYNAPVLFPAAQNWSVEIARTIWLVLRRILPQFDVAIFEKVPERIFELENPLILLGTSVHPASGHGVTLPGTWDALKGQLPRRENARYQTRRLNKLGKLSFAVADAPEKYDEFLTALMRQKSQRYLETRGVDGLDRPGYRDFLRKAKYYLSPAGPVRLCALKLNDIVIATSWGYVVGGRFYYLVLSFEGGDWRQYSLGRLMLDGLLEWCIAQGLKVLDCGVGDEDFKLEYCDISIPLRQVEIATTIRGRIYLLMRNARRELVRTKLWAALRPMIKRSGRK